MTRTRFPAWWLAVMLALVTVALYWPATRCDFINYDDGFYVTANVHVQKGLTLENIRWAFVNPVTGNWHPLTVLSHMMDCQFFGLKPWGHHLTSVLLHAINTALVLLLLHRLTGALWRSLLVAALFGWHPAHVESVAWVAERKDVLSVCFGLLSLIFYARYANKVTGGKRPVARGEGGVLKNSSETPLPSPVPAPSSQGEGEATRQVLNGKSKGESRESSVGHPVFPLSSEASSLATGHWPLNYLLSLVFFACGLMSKPMLVTWPFVMLLLDYWPLCRFQPFPSAPRLSSPVAPVKSVADTSAFFRRLPALLFEKIPFFALAAAASVVTFVVQKHEGVLITIQNLPLGARIGNALISYCRYLGKMFWPADLAVFYPHPGYWPIAKVLLAGGLLLGISVVLIVKQRRHPFLLVGWLWFCGTLAPVIQLVQTGSHAMGDRYTYIPSLGVFILAIWGVHEPTRRWRHHVIALSVAGSAAIVLCMALTRQQIGYWKDGETLFRHALEVTKNNHVAHFNLGNAFVNKGRIDEAISQYQEALRLEPNYVEAHFNLGNTLVNKGQLDSATGQYQEAIRLKPDYAEAHYSLGNARFKKGQLDEAISQYQEALSLKPDYAEAHYNLGTALFNKGQIDEAVGQYQEGIRLKPDGAEAHFNLGTALVSKGQLDEAISQFQEAIRWKPDYADAHNNLGIVLSMKGRIDEAISQYQEAVRLRPDDADAHNSYGIALEEKGQIDEAIRQFQEAIRLKPDYAQARDNLRNALLKEGQAGGSKDR